MKQRQPHFETNFDVITSELVHQKEFQQAILKIACSKEISKGSLTEAASLVTETVATVTPVARVSVWLFDSTRGAIDCIDQFILNDHSHCRGQRLFSHDFPGYFNALNSGRAIDAHDARTDPRTREFRNCYLEPQGITSMLDAAIRVDGRVRGVLCLEHVGPQRAWATQEIGFASEAADQFAFALLCAERGRLRSLLEHAQRLESLGLLVSGIAHDFNNLLTVIMGNLDLVNKGDATPEVSDAFLAAQSAAELTSKLLAFGQEQVLQQEVLNLSDIVQQTRPFLDRILTSGISLEFEDHAKDAFIEADRSQLEQIIMNLCINARDAINDCGEDHAGKITIRVESWDAPLSEVVLSVEDNGKGISEEMRDRIFEPFFTTKARDVGSGLGLAVIHGIVSQHHGRIEVESEVGKGTIFRLTFARTQKFPGSTDDSQSEASG